MTNTLIATLSVVVMLCSFTLAYWDIRRKRTLTVYALFIFVSIVFVNTGFLWRATEGGWQHWQQRAVLSVTVGLGLVSLVGSAVSTSFAVQTEGRRAIPVSERLSFLIAAVVGVIVVATSAIYFVELGSIPLYDGIRDLLRGGLSPGLLNSYRIARDVYVNPEARYIAGQGFMEMVRYFGLPLVACWFLRFYSEGRHRRFSILMIAACAVGSVLAGQRWPLMYFIVQVLLYLEWTSVQDGSRSLQRRKIVGAGVLIGLAITVLLGRSVVQPVSGMGQTPNAVAELMERVLLGNNYVPFESYRLFPQEYAYLFGESWLQNLKAFLPGPGASFPVTFSEMVVGIGGFTAPPDFYTEAFINFGWVGVIVLSSAIGVLLPLFERRSKRHYSSSQIATRALIGMLLGFAPISGMTFLIGGAIVITYVRVLRLAASLVLAGGRRGTTHELSSACGRATRPATARRPLLRGADMGPGESK